MKTAETIALEKAIRKETRKTGTFGCFEVTIGFFGKERVDYMTYDTKGIFRCYEIKVTKADFHSDAAKSFAGHYNYYVLPAELYSQIKDEIPDYVGVYVVSDWRIWVAKKAKKQDLSGKEYSVWRSVDGKRTLVSTPWEEMLKDSMIRSLFRDSDKLLDTQDEQYIGRLKRDAEKLEKDMDKEHKRYMTLCGAVIEELGEDRGWELINGQRKW